MRMTVSQMTPAGRLHRLLSEIRQKPPNQSIVQAWSEVLAIPLSRRAELFRTYAFVVGLPDEIAAEVEKVDQERFPVSLAMRWRDKVTRAFEVDFAGGVQLNHFTNSYDTETLAHLEWCDDVLRRGLPGRSALQLSDLERITDLVDQLERALSEDREIDTELRTFLLQHARAMAQAVRDVPVRGAAGLEEALDQALGDIKIRRRHLTERLGAERAQHLMAIIQAVLLALQVGLTAVQITQAGESPEPPRVTIELPAADPVPALPAVHPTSLAPAGSTASASAMNGS